MTLKEKLALDHPDCIGTLFPGGINGCPSNYGYDSELNAELNCRSNGGKGCVYCWNREISIPRHVSSDELNKMADEDKVPSDDKTISAKEFGEIVEFNKKFDESMAVVAKIAVDATPPEEIDRGLMHELPCDLQLVTTEKPQHGIKHALVYC